MIPDLTKSERETLKAIYRHSRDGSEAHTGDLAATLGVTPGTVTSTVKRLADRGLLTHRPYHGVTFSGEGQRHAVAAIRRHRIVERFLADHLGYSWREADRLAPTFEHELPDEVEERMYLALGSPTTCPHGFPIPASAEHAIPATPPLYDLEAGDVAEVAVPSSTDPAVVLFLDELGVRPGVQIEVREKHPFGGPLVLRVDGHDHDQTLGERIARRIYVRRLAVAAPDNPVSGGAAGAAGKEEHDPPVVPDNGGSDATGREKEGTTR